MSLDDGSEVIVEIGRPFNAPEIGEEFYCPYRITGLGDRKVRGIPGFDAVQALLLALQTVGVDLYASDEGKAGKLSWLGQRDLGFPLPDIASDLRPQ